MERTDNAQWTSIVGYHNIIKSFGREVEKKAFLATPIANIVNFSSDSVICLESCASIHNGVMVLSSHAHIHRLIVPIDGSDGQTHSVVSQSDIVKWALPLMTANSALLPFAQVPVGGTKFVTIDPVSVKSSTTLRQTLNTLIQSRVSCLAIVDEVTGALIGNFSESDTRGLGISILEQLETPIKEYLTVNSPSSLSPIFIVEDDTILTLMRLLVDTNVHHIFVNTKCGRLHGLVTLTDVMSMLLKVCRATIMQTIHCFHHNDNDMMTNGR